VGRPYHHNAFNSIVLLIFLQPFHQHPADLRMIDDHRVGQHVVHVHTYLCFDCENLLLANKGHILVA